MFHVHATKYLKGMKPPIPCHFGVRVHICFHCFETIFEACSFILLTKETLHQLISSLSLIYKVLYILGGAEFLPSTEDTDQKLMANTQIWHLSRS